MVNAAVELDEGPLPPSFGSGWGLADLERMIAPDDPLWILDQSELLNDTGDAWQRVIEVADRSQPLQITLAWTDAAAAAGADPTLVNDLDLRLVREDDGAIFLPWSLDPSNPAAPATTA